MKKFLTVLLALAMVLSMFGTTALAGADDNSVVFNINSEPPEMWTSKATDTTSFTLFRHLYSGLFDQDENDQPVPGVAESFEMSEDGLVYTYHLREDALWWDGQQVTANDFAYAFFTLIDPVIACDYADMALARIAGAREYFAGTATKEEVGIKVIDDQTLEITLVAPCAYWNSLMAFGVFMPLRQDYVEQYGDAYGTDGDKIMGNGPFKIENWAHESEFVMVKNDLFYNADQIQIDKLVAKMVSDANTALSMFETGELDILEVGNTIREAVKATDYELLSFGDGATFYLQFNVNEGQVTANLNLRKALAYAMDRGSFIKYVVGNDSLPAYYYTTPEIAGADGATPFGDATTPTYDDNDAAKAQEYLALACDELGMTAEEIASKITLIGDDTTAAINNLAAIQEYIKQNLGIEIVVENMPFKSRLERTTNREFSMVLGGWGPDYNDPMTFLEIMTTGNGNNKGDWSSEIFDTAIAAALVEPNKEAYFGYLLAAEQEILDDLPIVPIYHRCKDYVVEDGLNGVLRTAFQDYDLSYCSWGE